LVVDFETVDPYISRKFGAGWVFALNHNQVDFQLLGLGVYNPDTEEQVYLTDRKEMWEAIKKADTLIMFNAAYDLGCLLYLRSLAEDSKEMLSQTIIDVQLMAKLFRQDLMSYSLANLGTRFKLTQQKEGNKLADYVWDTGIYQAYVKKTKDRNCRTKPSEAVLYKYAIQNMTLLPEELVAEYCLQDVRATWDMYKYLSTRLDLKDNVDNDQELDYNKLSDLIKISVDIRRTGVPVDLDAAKGMIKLWQDIETKTQEEVNATAGHEINLHSSIELAELLTTLGVKDIPVTAKNAPSVTNQWLKLQKHPLCAKIAECREYEGMRTKFVNKIIQYQDVFDIKPDQPIVYISLHVFGATATGRYTSGPYGSESAITTSYEVSIHQIPSRHPIFGEACRSLFVAPKGYSWISADFSSQEQRIQVHLAELLGCEGADVIGDQWRADPNMSFHDSVAEITGLTRTEAKTISLGRSYGMGDAKLCESLGLPVVPFNIHGRDVMIAGKEGKAIITQYNQLLPYVVEVQKTTNDFFRKNGYIKTLGGRKLKLPTEYADIESRKGFSKYVQGSAADQTMIAMIKAYKAGLTVLFQVHDELNIIARDDVKEEAAKVLKDCMETAVPLSVPVLAETNIGKNWYQAKA
jgi:DNA polymerase-1